MDSRLGGGEGAARKILRRGREVTKHGAVWKPGLRTSCELVSNYSVRLVAGCGLKRKRFSL